MKITSIVSALLLYSLRRDSFPAQPIVDFILSAVGKR